MLAENKLGAPQFSILPKLKSDTRYTFPVRDEGRPQSIPDMSKFVINTY
jgi:hypothetical protein